MDLTLVYVPKNVQVTLEMGNQIVTTSCKPNMFLITLLYPKKTIFVLWLVDVKNLPYQVPHHAFRLEERDLTKKQSLCRRLLAPPGLPFHTEHNLLVTTQSLGIFCNCHSL
jgi:hypothetical protein